MTFGWEAYHRSDNGDVGKLLVALSVLEALAVAGLGSQIVWYAKVA